MHLPDSFIIKHGDKLIEPFDHCLVNPASYDITLADTGIFKGETVKLPFELQPGDFILVSSREYFKFPCDVGGQLLLKSTVGRNAINHMLAGWFDPDFHGTATMELKNEGHLPYNLIPGARIAQMLFSALTNPSSIPYRFKGRYYGQNATTPARPNAVSAPIMASTGLKLPPMWLAGPFLGSDSNHNEYVTWWTDMSKLHAGELDQMSNPGFFKYPNYQLVGPCPTIMPGQASWQAWTGCHHDFPSPWLGTMPPSCRKCGEQAKWTGPICSSSA